MYAKKLADVYDAIYSTKDYARETSYLLSTISKYHPEARSLLETACGTGRFLEALRLHLDVCGQDISPEMLAVGAKRVPEVRLYQSDMARLAIDAKFDVVCCLFRSIAYLKTSDRLFDAVGAMARHLSPNGIVIIEPFFTPETFSVGKLTCNHYHDDSLDISWMYASERPASRLGRYPIHYLVGTGAGVEHFTETHDLGLFTLEDYQTAFARAGLRLVHDPVGLAGTGLHIGLRSRGD